MKLKTVIFFIFFLIEPFENLFAQYLNTDSLKQLLNKNHKRDTAYVQLLSKYGVSLWHANHDEAEEIIRHAIELSENINWEKGQVTGLVRLSQWKSWVQEFDSAAILGIKALKIAEEINDPQLMSIAHQGLDDIYYYMGDFSKSMFHSKKFLEFAIAARDTYNIMRANLDVALNYADQKKYTESKKFEDEAMKIAIVLNNDYGINMVLSIKAQKEYDQKNYRLAKEYFEKSFLYKKSKNDHGGASYNASRLAIINSYLNNKDSAYFYGELAKREAEEFGLPKELGDAYESLYEISLKFNDFHNAVHYHMLYDSIKDAKLNTKTSSAVEKAVMKHEQDKKDALALAEIKNQKLVRDFSFTVAIMILIFSGYGAYWYRRKKKMQNQQALMKERLRISRELHDEVGATLSGIAMYSHLTREQVKSGSSAEVDKSLNLMQESSTDMVSKLNDIVWLINPGQDSLEKLIQRLEEYARDMTMAKKMRFVTTMPEHVQKHDLSMETRRNVYLLCKEAINNAVKYSGGTLLELKIEETQGKLQFSITDNGKGFDKDMVKRGNGLDNMQKRADEIGANLVLVSKENRGTSLLLQCKIT